MQQKKDGSAISRSKWSRNEANNVNSIRQENRHLFQRE